MKETNISQSPDSESLSNELRAIDITVPLRTEGRKTEHTERWVICRLLSTLNNCNKLTFPVSLTHRDRPDFLLGQGLHFFGIEATEAIIQEYAAFSALAEREFPDALLDPGHFKPGSSQKKNNEMRCILRQVQLTGPPSVGNRGAEDWAVHMESIVRLKLKKLAEKGFEKFDENWLAIYSNLSLPSCNILDASQRLVPKIANLWDCNPAFDRIYIEHRKVILEIRKQSVTHLKLEDI
jgi:hypothetical protein